MKISPELKIFERYMSYYSLPLCKKNNTYSRDISHSVDGNLLLAVQPFPVLDGSTSQSNHTHTQNVTNSSSNIIIHRERA